MNDLASVVADIAAEMKAAPDRGRQADYIPPLAEVPIDRFGMAVICANGDTFTGGDAEEAFSIQSISKVFALTLALGAIGDQLWERVGKEPSGSAFNSIVQLESEHGIPRNPFINAGAIVVADVLLGSYHPNEVVGELVRFVRALAGDDSIMVDEAVARAEHETGFRNFGLANFMRSFGNIRHPVEDTLSVYFHQCAIRMNCVQLARAGRYLALDGWQPDTCTRVISAQRARRINALMLSCGHYDNSGEFAFRIGLPGKSGVGGGILAVAPGIASIAVWSPGLNEKGNSQLGALALERLTQATGWSVFEPQRD